MSKVCHSQSTIIFLESRILGEFVKRLIKKKKKRTALGRGKGKGERGDKELKREIGLHLNLNPDGINNQGSIPKSNTIQDHLTFKNNNANPKKKISTKMKRQNIASIRSPISGKNLCMRFIDSLDSSDSIILVFLNLHKDTMIVHSSFQETLCLH